MRENTDNLFIMSYWLQGARAVVMRMQAEGCKLHRGKESDIYDRVLYRHLLQDEKVLRDWLAGCPLKYLDHKIDGKGKLIDFRIETYDNDRD